MRLLQLIIWGLFFYLAFKLIANIFKPEKREPEVKGKPEKSSLDLRNQDVEDADFEDIP